MTPTHGTAASGPQTADAATIGRASSRRGEARGRRCFARRELLALPAVLALLVGAAPAVAQTSSTGTSGYNQKPPTPTTKTEPKTGVAPSKETTTPKAAPEPAKATAPTTTTAPKASTLPFTGLNLTWVLGAGALLLAAGLSMRLALRTRAGR